MKVFIPFSDWSPCKRLLLLSLTTLVVGGFAYFMFVDWAFSNAVSRATVLKFRPVENPQRAVAEEQNEGHTCGLHALRSLYRAYQLPPERHSLRYRMGVDRGAVPKVSSTQGTLQPDLTRVLAQDGFEVALLSLDEFDAVSKLRDHLNQGDLGIALIRRLANGNLHWVLVQENSVGQLEVVDSLLNNPRQINGVEFLQSQAVSIFMVSARAVEVEPQSAIKAAHRLGVEALRMTPRRVKVLESR